jgi:hypothetical protein
MEELESKILHLMQQGWTPERITNALLYKKVDLQDIGKAMMRLKIDVNEVRKATGLNRTWLLAVSKKDV